MRGGSGKPEPGSSLATTVLDTGSEYLRITTDADATVMMVQSNEQHATPGHDPAATAGLIDLQVNGFGGVDFNNDQIDAADIDHALAAMLATGVTTCLPTIITASKRQLHKRLRALDRAVSASSLGPRMVPGYHLEGPFLNPQQGYAGCHPSDDMVPPSVKLFRDLEKGLERPILYLTLAPELERSLELIRWAAERHKIVGVGHSTATRKVLSAALTAGLQVSTHLGNGVAQVLPKFDNPIQWQLADDRLTGCFIADGVHIPAEILKSFIRAKGVERSVLVTDAIAAAAAPAGTYTLGGMLNPGLMVL